ncbi:MAG: bifunctional 3-(3-hydroxy-phenyl)propionate/3-hydroxycinnamic acid hydroxylase [Rhizobiales bacterium]|nr:bifunctional 3-(3-hydroxy-phenyl)propionate/3-hydroxycinnamic acid hydroxylase [Hyphomicrobiales bacterium]
MTYDVLIVGYGPTGMLAATLLGRAGHRVGVFERHKSLYNLPRVGIVHDDVLRMFQEVGCIDRIWPSTYFLPVYELAKHGKVLLSSNVAPNATHGWPEYISIYQPAFEAELDKLAKAQPTVDVFQGQRVVAIDQNAERVEIEVEDESGARRRVQGRYLIGADGGNSFVRETLGIRYENLGFDQDWLVIDARVKHERSDMPAMRQLCEPEQPGVTLRMGPHHRRWSFMIFPGESPEDAVKPESVWRRLNRPEGGTADEFELVRVASYKFQSLFAERWRDGRVFLAGDSAHQMPPFLAQGLCSGFRDAHNLAWKLDLVLKGKAQSSFLDTYMAERGPNARATIVESMRVGLHVNERDPEKVARRDAELMALQAEKERTKGQKQLIAFRVPGFESGFVAQARGGVHGAGDALVQGRVRHNGKEDRFDDLAGRGFIIITRDGDPASALSRDDLDYWSSLGGRSVRIGQGSADGDSFVDVEGRYGQLMDEYGCNVIVKRPDYYIFGACPTVAGLPALMADLRHQLQA